MDVNHITEFLNMIGCRKIKPLATKVLASCPFEYAHSGGEDKSPSFAVMDKGKDESTWQCYTCNKGGLLEWLVDELGRNNRFKLGSEFAKEKSSGVTLKDLYSFIIKHDRVDVSKLMQRAQSLQHYAAPTYHPIPGVHVDPIIAAAQVPDALPHMPDSFLTDYFEAPSGKGLKYLKTRGVSDASITEWEIRWHPGQRRVTTPIRDLDQGLVGLSGRSIDKNPWRKHLHSTGFQRKFYLYGEHKVKPGGTGILVEGQFDVIALWQYGYRFPVGVFGSTLTQQQADKAVRIFKDVIILTDPDEPGQRAAEQYVRAIGGRIPTRHVEMLGDFKDPGDLMEKGTLDDAIEILGPPQVY